MKRSGFFLTNTSKARAFQEEEQDMRKAINGIRKEEVKLYLMNMPKIG